MAHLSLYLQHNCVLQSVDSGTKNCQPQRIVTAIVGANVRVRVLVVANAYASASVLANAFLKEKKRMLTVSCTFHFPGQYIEHPYWPEMAEFINITKESGMNRAKSSANRRKALEEHLKSKGMTVADFDKLKELAERPFHFANGKIIIPADKILSFLVATCDEARAAQKPCPPEQVRSRFRATDFETTKEKSDGTWSRFATVTSGTGAKLSNQRGLRNNEYIENFDATGSLTFDPSFVKPDVLKNAISWGGQMVGIGASRKMGKGRFDLTHFEPT